MDRGRDPSRASHYFGLRFRERETERAYQDWRVGTATGFARIGYIGSTPSWILVLVSMLVLDPENAAEGGVWVAGWIVLLMVLTALTVPERLKRTITPLAALANCLAGFLIVWLIAEVVLVEEVAQTRVGVMTAGMIVVMFFGFTVFRVPPGIAMAAVTPYTAFGTYQLWNAHAAGDLNAIEAGSLTAAHWIAYLGCLLVCIVIERVARRTFCKDRLIATQQEELRSQRETIRRYVPQPVFDHIVGGDIAGIDVPTRRRVTVLFADLVGFTDLADRVEPEVLTRVVNDYMTAMSQLVDSHGGIVNEFAGDGLMALFGAPDAMDPEEQVVAAVEAAQEMQALLPTLNRQWQRLGATRPMRTRIGISTGVLSVGSFGSEGRMTYTAIGLHTNIAARIQSHCEPGQILLSDASWHLVKDRIPCDPRGAVECKGVHYPVPVYCPAPLASDLVLLHEAPDVAGAADGLDGLVSPG